jgi:hypothetical protein
MHVDLQPFQAASFVMLSAGGRTVLALAHRHLPNCAATLHYALAAIGIATLYHSAIDNYAIIRNFAPALTNMAVLLTAGPLLLRMFQPLDVTDDADRPGRRRGWSLLGDIATAWGAMPHFGPGTEPGSLRIVLFVTSYAFSLGQPYSSTVQHHRSHICIQFWCFMSAIHFLFEDRHTSHNAHIHWGVGARPGQDTYRTAEVIKNFLLAASTLDDELPLEDAFHRAWATKLAVAWKADAEYNKRDVPPWAREFFDTPPPQQQQQEQPQPQRRRS